MFVEPNRRLGVVMFREMVFLNKNKGINRPVWKAMGVQRDLVLLNRSPVAIPIKVRFRKMGRLKSRIMEKSDQKPT